MVVAWGHWPNFLYKLKPSNTSNWLALEDGMYLLRSLSLFVCEMRLWNWDTEKPGLSLLQDFQEFVRSGSQIVVRDKADTLWQTNIAMQNHGTSWEITIFIATSPINGPFFHSYNLRSVGVFWGPELRFCQLDHQQQDYWLHIWICFLKNASMNTKKSHSNVYISVHSKFGHA